VVEQQDAQLIDDPRLVPEVARFLIQPGEEGIQVQARYPAWRPEPWQAPAAGFGKPAEVIAELQQRLVFICPARQSGS
jgi:hypothetical protein